MNVCLADISLATLDPATAAEVAVGLKAAMSVLTVPTDVRDLAAV